MPRHEIELTKPQSQILQLTCKNPLFVGGYGSGKTEALICSTLRDALYFRGAKVGSYCPTYDLLKLNLIPRLEEALALGDINFSINRSDHIITLENESQIIMRSMDNPGRIIAYEVFRSHVDEIDTLPRDKAEHVWRKIIARNRQKIYQNGEMLQNTVSAYTTPDYGFASFTYNRWKKNGGGEYQYIKAPTHSNPHLPVDYVDQLRDTYSEELIQAYVEGEWCNFTSGQVYHSYDRLANHSFESIRKGEVLRVGMDFNVNKMAAIIYVARKNGWHAVEEKTDGVDTPDMIEWLKENFGDHSIIVYPDATGNSRKTTDASKSDIKLLKKAGFKVKAKSVNPRVRDRILAMNKQFKNQKLWVNDDTCPNYAECLEQQGYDKNGQPDKTAGFDHANDAGGYPVAYEFPIEKPIHGGMTEGLM